MNREMWLKAVAEVQNAPLPPSDALTTSEFGELIGLSRQQATKRLQDLVAAGKAERTTKLLRRNNCGVVSVPAYRLIETGKAAVSAATRSDRRVSGSHARRSARQA